MPVYITQGEGKDYKPCPEGLFQAVCVDVVDLGIRESKFGKKHKLALVWQVLATDDDGNPVLREDGKRHEVQAWYTASSHKKAALTKDLQVWRGQPFTPEEAKKFDVENVIGANCQLQIIHSAPNEDGRVYANKQVLVPYKGKLKIAPLDYVRVKDRPTEDGNGNSHAVQTEEDEEALPF